MNACVQCDSNTDAKCATNPDQFLAKECANSSSKCYSRVVDGATIRGCAAELSNETISNCRNELECLVCSFVEGCNRQIFPQHRAQCLQCEGNSTGTCALDSFAKATICPIYKLGDKCFIRRTNANNTQSFMRGCLSSANAKKLCIDQKNCFTCEGNGCNYIPFDTEQIPLARDSSGIMSFSVLLILMFALLVAFIN